MDIESQLDSLHLSEESHRKFQKLSRIHEQKEEPTAFSADSRLLRSPKFGTLSSFRDEYSPSEKNEENTHIRRSGRRKSAPVRWNGVSDLPKNVSSLNDNLAAIEKFYLDRLVKKKSLTRSLEKIFEETQKNESSLQNLMSLRKLSRSIHFSRKVSPGKIRKRQLKASKAKPERSLNFEVSLEKNLTKFIDNGYV